MANPGRVFGLKRPLDQVAQSDRALERRVVSMQPFMRGRRLLTGATLLAVAMALAPSQLALGADRGASSKEPGGRSVAQGETMKIRLKVNGKSLEATLRQHETTRDFLSLLPLTITMRDLFGREKFGHLPRAISDAGERTRSYQVGEIAYWSPGPDIAIFYHHDGQTVPAPGLIVIGKVGSGMEMFNAPGPLEVTIERATD
jgi:hypothetical protein